MKIAMEAPEDYDWHKETASDYNFEKNKVGKLATTKPLESRLQLMVMRSSDLERTISTTARNILSSLVDQRIPGVALSMEKMVSFLAMPKECLVVMDCLVVLTTQ